MLIDSLSITRIFSVFGLFIITAIAEILGCYFPYLILKEGKSVWLWLPTALSLAVFVWLLTLHPQLLDGFMQPMAVFIFYCAYVASFCRSGRFNQMGYLGWHNRALRSRFNYFTATRINPLILRVII